ncbi:MAG: CoA-binding protein [Proteobacteria bacterium]|nr:CoA-binding protein [Pseudomonadota bacterium]
MIIKPAIDIRSILKKYKTIAVVGLSPKITRPSNQVADYLIRAGYEVIPVNPGQNEILGRTCYPDLLSIPESVDLVDIFRKPEDVPAVVDEAIAIGAKVIWMQLGIINDEAAKKATAAGLTVIMDRCIKVDHQNLR